MAATDYSVGSTVRIAIPLKLNPEFAIAWSRHAGRPMMQRIMQGWSNSTLAS